MLVSAISVQTYQLARYLNWLLKQIILVLAHQTRSRELKVNLLILALVLDDNNSTRDGVWLSFARKLQRGCEEAR